MSTTFSTLDVEVSRWLADARAECAEKAGRAWLEENQSIVASYPSGTVIAINVADASYVVAASGLAAIDLFETTFGKEAVAWVHEVGIPITLGGGMWALSSGA